MVLASLRNAVPLPIPLFGSPNGPDLEALFVSNMTRVLQRTLLSVQMLSSSMSRKQNHRVAKQQVTFLLLLRADWLILRDWNLV